MIALLTLLSTEGAHEASESSSAMPVVAGVVAFVILMAMLFGVLAFGKGREHS